MRKIRLFVFFTLLAAGLYSQGKFSGSLKTMIGKKYADSRKMPGLTGWQFREGTVITPIDDPEMITVDVYQKGTTYAVVFSVMEDTAVKVFEIYDVLEIKNVVKGWQVKTATCSASGQPDIEIIALAKETPAEKIKVIKKAWRFNRDKKRLESLPVKGVECINEGMD